MLAPLHDYVIIKLKDPETKTPGGFFLPDTSSETQTTGTVIATGPGIYEFGVLRPVSVSPNDQVLFGKFAGQKIYDKGIEYIVMKDKELIAVERPDPVE